MRPTDPTPPRLPLRAWCALACCAGVLAACSKPAPPTDRPPEPQAAATAPTAATAPARGALEDYIQSPQDKARAVEPAVLDAAKQQDQAIDAQSQ